MKKHSLLSTIAFILFFVSTFQLSSKASCTIDLIAPTEACLGEVIVLSASPGFASYSWSTGETTQSIVVSHNTADYHYYEVTGFTSDGLNCMANAYIHYQEAQINPRIVGPTEACANECYNLSAYTDNPPSIFNVHSYAWSTGDDTETITVCTPGYYEVTISYDGYCDAVVGYNVDLAPIGQASFIGNTEVCQGECWSLYAGYAWNYEWKDLAGNVLSTWDLFEPCTPGTYILNYSVLGCSYTDTFDLTYLAAPYPIMPLSEYCANETNPATLTVEDYSHSDGYQSYLWNTGETTSEILVYSSQIYYVTVTDFNGCTAVASIDIRPKPEVFIDANVGPNGGTLLSADPTSDPLNTTYYWNTGEFTPEIEVFDAGTYTVYINTPDGCVAEDSYIIETVVEPAPCLPTNIYTLPVTNTEMLVGWDALTDAQNYQVRYRLNNTSDPFTVVGAGGPNTSVNLTGLDDFRVYEYRVRAKCNGEWGNYSSVQRFFTSTCPTPDFNSITINYPTNDRVKLTWNPLSEAVRYQIRYRESGTSSWTTIGSTPGNNFKTIAGLTAGTTYQYRLRTDCGGGTFSQYSDIGTFTTTNSNREAQKDLSSTLESVTIFPNPASDILNVQLEAQGEIQVIVRDMNGKVIMTQSMNHGTQSIQINKLNQGQYIIQCLVDGKTLETKRFVKL